MKVSDYRYEVGDALVVYDEYTHEWCGAIVEDFDRGEYTLNVCSTKIGNHKSIVKYRDIIQWRNRLNCVDEGKYNVNDEVVYVDGYGMLQPARIVSIHNNKTFYLKKFNDDEMLADRKQLDEWQQKLEHESPYKIDEEIYYPSFTNCGDIVLGDLDKHKIIKIGLVYDEKEGMDYIYTLMNKRTKKILSDRVTGKEIRVKTYEIDEVKELLNKGIK